MKPVRLKNIFAAAVLCLACVGCASETHMSVYKELLTEARWLYHAEAPAIEDPDAYLFNFQHTGTVKIYQVYGEDVRTDTVRELNYIYDPDMARMAIQEYGLYTVEEINTDRIVLFRNGAEAILERYKAPDPIEEREENDTED